MGYHFLSPFAKEEFRLSTMDSSLLNTLIHFGFLGFSVILSLFLLWSRSQWVNFCRIKEKNPSLYNLFKMMYAYLILMIFFTSQFNNCLYYPFWLIPVIAF